MALFLTSFIIGVLLVVGLKLLAEYISKRSVFGGYIDISEEDLKNILSKLNTLTDGSSKDSILYDSMTWEYTHTIAQTLDGTYYFIYRPFGKKQMIPNKYKHLVEQKIRDIKGL